MHQNPIHASRGIPRKGDFPAWASLALALALLALLLAYQQHSAYRSIIQQHAGHLVAMARIAGQALDTHFNEQAGQASETQRSEAPAVKDDAYVLSVLASLRYAPDAWSALIQDDGGVLLELPGVSTHAVPDAAGELFRRHRRSGQRQSAAEGVVQHIRGEQIMAFFTLKPGRPASSAPLTVALGRSKNAVLASWYLASLIQAGVFLVAALCAYAGLRAHRRRQAERTAAAASAQAHLRASAEDYSLVVEHTNDLVMRMDASGRIVYANPALCELLGKTREQITGSAVADILPANEKGEFPAGISALGSPPHTASFRRSHRTGKGRRQLCWLFQGLLDPDGHMQEVVAIGRDVTHHAPQPNNLELLARQDFLTGLSNRRHFLEQAEIEIERARRFKSSTSLLLIDLDHFKAVNDAHGYKAGDQVLAALGDMLRLSLRWIDITGRMGGDEFAILLPATNMDAALKVAQRLGTAIHAQEIELDGGARVRCAASIGISSADHQDCTLEKLMDQAGLALHQAKHTGRNRVCAWGQTLYGV
ncbi:diguanylate cyclase [Alcaligenaceae bacterium]|nr:diguanylate cyclase [Alcaligenaceae bacterium]